MTQVGTVRLADLHHFGSLESRRQNGRVSGSVRGTYTLF